MFLRNASNICTTLRHTRVSNKMLEEKTFRIKGNELLKFYVCSFFETTDFHR